MSDVKLDIPITQQKVFIALSSKQLSSRKFELKINELKSDLDFENSMIGIGIEMKKFDSQSLGGKAERLSVQGIYKNGVFVVPSTISLIDGVFFQNRLQVAAIEAEITRFESDSFSGVMASLKSADLFIGETFVTALPANTLEANLHYSLSNQKLAPKTIFNDPFYLT